MKCIEENTERMDLLEKTLQVEEKQKKRLLDLTLQREKDQEKANLSKLHEGNMSASTSMLDQEDAQRKHLVDEMVSNTTPSNAPVVRVLTNLQGIYIDTFYIYI